MKLAKTLLIIVSALCFISLTGCSLSKIISGKPTPSPMAQPGNNRANQPSDTPAAQSEESKATTNETATNSNEATDELHTPPKGSAERQAIMDALREEFDNRKSASYQPHRGAITFVVNYLKVHNGWAWTYASPQSSDRGDSFGENSGFLLHFADSRWQVMNRPPMVNDPNDPENLDYPSRKDVEKIKRMYPSIPTDIFPRK